MADVKKRKIRWTIPLLITIFSLSFPTYAQYGGGTGEPNDPYLIYTADQMNAIGANQGHWDKHFKLMADIDLSQYMGEKFNIIGERYYESGWTGRAFTGIFDGNGKKISNFTYSSTDVPNLVNIGLFVYVNGENAQIKDLGLINPNIDAGMRGIIGSLVGHLRDGAISNCYVDGGNVAGRPA